MFCEIKNDEWFTCLKYEINILKSFYLKRIINILLWVGKLNS